MQSTTSGKQYMLTAGHCYQLGQVVSNPQTVAGYVAQRQWATGASDYDFELLNNDPHDYQGYVYTTSNATLNSPTLPVHDGNRPTPLKNYCYSGDVTFWTCSHTVVSLDDSMLCDSGTSNCDYFLTSLYGGVDPRDGDSGAGLFWNYPDGCPDPNVGQCLGARGILIGSDGTYDYAENWTEITSVYGQLLTIHGT